MNVLRADNGELVPVNYSDLLDKILKVLRTENPFGLSSDRRRLRIDIEAISAHLATLQVENPLGASERSAHSATVNFSPDFESRFPRQIRQIRDCLQQHLESTIGEGISIRAFAASLAADLHQFRGSTGELGLKYDFDKRYSGLKKQKITLSGNTSQSNSLLKFHKLTVTVRKPDEFAAQFQQSLANYIEEKAESEADREDLQYSLSGMVADTWSDFHQVLRIVNRETLGKLKKEAKIRYLEYLLENSSIGSAPNANSIYLEDLIRRLRLIEEYINDPSKDEGYYTVNYAGVSVNYRDLFSRAEALDALPVIPIVAGYLGETADKNTGDRNYIFGLKLKLGKPVQARGGKPVFDYYLNLLDPDSEVHQAALAEADKSQSFAIKVLKIAFLYYFVFASPWNPEAEDYHPASELDYTPIGSFDEKVMPWLRSANDAAKQNLFRSLKNSFAKLNVRIKIDRLKHLLENLLTRQTHLPSGNYPVHIGVRRGILESDINSLLLGHFFNGVVGRNPKECLQYISVGEPRVDERFLCQMSARISIEDIRYFSADERQEFSMEYNIKDIEALPVLWVPETCMNTYKRQFMKDKLVLFCYNNRRLDASGLQGLQGFVYRFTFSLLAYVCLKLLLDGAEENLFIPMVRLHEGTQDNPSPSEEFVAAIAKVLSHLFSEKHKSNCQGFRIQNQNSKFSVQNGLSSLYSVLPKKFYLKGKSLSPDADKLAIIIVSSRESDVRLGNANSASRIANLLGEIVSLRQLEEGTIQIEPLKTFSENYSRRRLYSNPPILQDVASELYGQGYRHFLYVAQAPYSSTLHVTQGEEDEELFFMSPEVIKSLKGNHSDIKIYPVFFDKYYVRARDEKQEFSRYIQDTRELTNLVSDPSRQVVVFFNLFNGLKVGNDRFYRGVISYSTLLNIYPADILDDRDIWQGLILETPVKDAILQYLTLFHFSRYEARQSITFKLDPYEKIIGDESIGALSLFYHARGMANFNSLAFLTEVRNILNAEQVGTQE